MGFENLNTEAGVATLNTFIADKSYIEGFNASQADVAVFEALSGVPSEKNSHALRWYNHIAAHKAAFATYTSILILPCILIIWCSLPGTKKAASEYGISAAPVAAAADEDDVDLFGSDEEEDEEVTRAKAERLAAYNAKKAAKGPGPIAKSSVVLDVKPWDDETDLAVMEKAVRDLEIDGLIWGASKLVPIGYGIKKLQISCVIEDDKVGIDLINDSITEIEELVQSVDIVSFNKV